MSTSRIFQEIRQKPEDQIYDASQVFQVGSSSIKNATIISPSISSAISSAVSSSLSSAITFISRVMPTYQEVRYHPEDQIYDASQVFQIEAISVKDAIAWLAPTRNMVLAGVSAGVAEITAGQPFDTTAKRLQRAKGKIGEGVRGGGDLKSIVQSIQLLLKEKYQYPNRKIDSKHTVNLLKTYFKELKKVIFNNATGEVHFSNLYNGYKEALLYKAFQRTHKLAGKDYIYEKLEKYCEKYIIKLVGEKYYRENKKTILTFFAAVIVGGTEVMYLPLDLMKVRKQTAKNNSEEMNKSLWEIAKKEKVYNGIYVTFTRNVIGSSFFFLTPLSVSKYFYKRKENEDNKTLTHMESTIVRVSGPAASIVSIAPLDTVKTRLQANNETISGITMAKNIWRNEGSAAFFKGCLTKLLVHGPKVSLAVFVYDKTKETLDSNTMTNKM